MQVAFKERKCSILLRFAIADEEFREHEPIKVIALADIDRKFSRVKLFSDFSDVRSYNKLELCSSSKAAAKGIWHKCIRKSAEPIQWKRGNSLLVYQDENENKDEIFYLFKTVSKEYVVLQN